MDVDLVVIGAGPAGYTAAIYGAQAGLKTALVYQEHDLGGTCLNRGCIPSKTLLASSERVHNLKSLSDHGISLNGTYHFDYKKVAKRKEDVLLKMQKGLQVTVDSFGVERLEGRAEFVDPYTVRVVPQQGDGYWVKARFIIIATGSIEQALPFAPFDAEWIHNSTSFLEIQTLPATLAIIGGGYIGCEMATAMAHFGVDVTLIEALPHLLSNLPEKAGQNVRESLISKGVEVRTNTKVSSVEKKSDHISLQFDSGERSSYDLLLIAVGRAPLTKPLSLEKAAVATDEKGFIQVLPSMQTSMPHIYAVGDVTGKLMLAHAGGAMAKVAVDHILHKERSFHVDRIPLVIFTSPEIAAVGNFTGSEITYPMSALGKAEASGETEGSVTLYIDKKSKRINGALLIGKESTNLIAICTLAIENELLIDQFDTTVVAHPTYSEAIWEAALMSVGKQTHYPRRPG